MKRDFIRSAPIRQYVNRSSVTFDTSYLYAAVAVMAERLATFMTLPPNAPPSRLTWQVILLESMPSVIPTIS